MQQQQRVSTTNYGTVGVCSRCGNTLAKTKQGSGWVHPLYDDLPQGTCPPRGSTYTTVSGEVILRSAARL